MDGWLQLKQVNAGLESTRLERIVNDILGTQREKNMFFIESITAITTTI